ncbi:MAG TPA: SDR family NAD(P)-dependent oxidoreductase, partial [Saprospiraceae bacterium]|nr:SDR family NAD(P)-dependent oxidoreductase [Saprospiraceae bacterium]
LTTALVQALQQRGHQVAVFTFGEDLVRKSAQVMPEGVLEILLPDTRDETLGQMIAQLPGSVARFIYLHPHLRFPLGQLGLHFNREKSLLKAAFLLAKHLKAPLHTPKDQQRPAFLTISRLDGALGTQNPGNVAPLGGSLPGLTKSLHLEWPGVFCRAVDMAPELPAEQAARLILGELYDADQCLTEVAWNATGLRYTLVAEPQSAPKTPVLQSTINKNSVFLVTGGARGVTAECVRHLAAQFKCTFVLLGRSGLQTAEPEWAHDIIDAGELKRKAMEALQAQGEKPLPKTIQRMTGAVTAQREIQANLDFIRAQGASVVYEAADVTDAVAIKTVLDRVTIQTGKITGIIHGAGVLADKRIENKTEADFDAVFDVKIQGLLAVTQAVDIEAIRHVVLFSSVAGFYGNVGQTDYAMANEALNRIAHLFRKNHPSVHVVSINWGAWDAGMVSPELKKVFEAHGVALVPSTEGPIALADQLSTAFEHQTQVILGGTLPMARALTDGPLTTYRIRRRLLESANPFLGHHVIQGHAVLPIINASTWMVQSAAALYPGFYLQKAEKVKLFKGIVFDGKQPDEYLLTVKELEKDDNRILVQVNITSDAGLKLPVQHFQSIVTLGAQPVAAPPETLPDIQHIQPVLADASVVYTDGTLFHGTDFQGVRQVLELNESGTLLLCEHPGIPPERQGQFPVKQVNAFLTDVMYQGLLIWVRRFNGCACLPLRTEWVDIYAPLPFGRPFYVDLKVVQSDDFAMEADITAFDAETGIVYMKSHRAGVTISRDLKWE